MLAGVLRARTSLSVKSNGQIYTSCPHKEFLLPPWKPFQALGILQSLGYTTFPWLPVADRTEHMGTSHKFFLWAHCSANKLYLCRSWAKLKSNSKTGYKVLIIMGAFASSQPTDTGIWSHHRTIHLVVPVISWRMEKSLRFFPNAISFNFQSERKAVTFLNQNYTFF